MDKKSPLVLTEDLLIGSGSHKKVYLDPADASRCVKIPFSEPDVDLERELRYRRSREKRHLDSTLLPGYFGTVETNLGKGYVFERVSDYDGSTSRTIESIFQEDDPAFGPAEISRLLFAFRDTFFREKIITSNMEPVNFAVQEKSPGSYQVRVIDNVGSPSHLPLAFYLDFVAQKRVRRYWNRLIDDLEERFAAKMKSLPDHEKLRV